MKFVMEQGKNGGQTSDKSGGLTSVFGFLFFLILLSILSLPQPASAGATMNRPTNMLGMIGYWTFDGKDMSPNVRDASGNGNHGNLTGQISTSTVLGKVGQALSFDGINDYVDTTNFADNLAQITISGWYKTSDFSAERTIISKVTDTIQPGAGNGWSVTIQPYGSVNYNIQNDGTNHYVNTSTNPHTDGLWHHFVISSTGRAYGTASIYVDGVLDNTGGGTGGSTPTDISNNLSVKIGINSDLNSAHAFHGSLDDIRIYNRALSATEVKGLYNSGSAKVSKSSSPGTLANGLVGHWSFDGKDMTPNVRDVSSQGNHGNLSGQTSTTTIFGKIGQAMTFDGSNDYITVPDNSSLQASSAGLSVSLWFKADTVTGPGALVAKDDVGSIRDYSIYRNGNELTVQVFDSVSGNSTVWSGIGGGYFTAGEWVHALFTYDPSDKKARVYQNGVLMDTGAALTNGPNDSNIPVTIGAYTGPAYLYSGVIDDARIYNRVLTSTEIKQLYAMGGSKMNTSKNTSGGSLKDGLIGLWSFDGKDIGARIFDRSGNGNHGDYVGATTTTIGKIGQAISVNGSNNKYVDFGRVSATEGVSTLSWSLWVKGDFTGTSDHGCFLCKGDPNFGTAESWLIKKIYPGVQSTTNDLIVSILTALNSNDSTEIAYTSGQPLINNQWNHVLVVFDGTQSGNSNRLKMYVNGVQASLTYAYTVPATTLVSAYPVRTGTADGARNFVGDVDDIRIYNRSLSASEVKQLYNMGR